MSFRRSLSLSRHRAIFAGCAFSLLAILACELLLSIRHLSQTSDEGAHIYAGYQHIHARDFGVNPEHPPLVKLIAAAPLAGMNLRLPTPLRIGFMAEEYDGGGNLLYANDADAILRRTRTAASLFTFVLALLILAAASEMFGAPAGIIALFLFVFEPTLLAHGALVTTDMGVTAGIFATVYLFYRFVKSPTPSRLLLASLAAGLAVATKMTAVLIFPILLVCIALELLWEHRRRARTPHVAGSTPALSNRVPLLLGALACITLSAYVILWAFYTFRYDARPAGIAMTPTLSQYALGLPTQLHTSVVNFLARWHLLPEAYLYGWAKIPNSGGKDSMNGQASPGFLFGKVYPHGMWFYFPAALLIKTSLPLLLLLLTSIWVYVKGLRPRGREIIFTVVPPVLLLAASMNSLLNIGVRHVLPLYPFLIVLVAGAAWTLAGRSRAGAIAVTLLLTWQAVSSLHTFPNYLAYANEAFGGSSHSYRVLSDSNVDWGQQAKQVKTYLDERHIKDCWFAYSLTSSVATYYGIPCKPLPTGLMNLAGIPQAITPPRISGTILISALDLSGTLWGPGTINPYYQFLQSEPDDEIADSILVYHGTYDVPLVAAESHASTVPMLMRSGQPEAALQEAQTAATLAPDSPAIRVRLGSLLLAQHRNAEADAAFNDARTMTAERTQEEASHISALIARETAPPPP